MRTRYTQLLVHMNTGVRNARRLEYALQIAAPQEAAIEALYAVTPSLLSNGFIMEAGASAVQTLAELDEARLQGARADFLSVTTSTTWPMEWAVAEGGTTAQIVRHALLADLLVLEQCQHVPLSGAPADFIETLLMDSGRPAIVLPASPAPYEPPGTILVAWKPTREAAHAIAAALPLLQRASEVHVARWGRRDECEADDRRLDRYLERHDVRVNWIHPDTVTTREIGEQIESLSFDLGAELLVMGCYGHRRSTEWMLGGATRTVLKSMTLPVLMAH